MKARLTVDVGGEHFELAKQQAQTDRRYAFISDIVRLERVIEQRLSVTGYAVFLTNDHTHWQVPQRGFVAQVTTRICEGATLTGVIRRAPTAAGGEEDVSATVYRFRGIYPIRWHDYSAPTGAD